MTSIVLHHIPISLVHESELDPVFSKMLSGDRLHHIVTLNPEMVVQAHRDDRYHHILEKTFNTADGFGIILAAKLQGHRVTGKDRLTGVSMTKWLLSYAEKNNIRVSVLVPHNVYTAPQLMQKKISTLYPKLSVEIIIESDGALLEINQKAPGILFVAFGAPRQEYWINEHTNNLPSVRIAAGIGGTFDFISGTIKRAPKLLRAIGCEWVWRLMREPKRIMRIFRAVILFPIIITRHR